MKIDVNLNNTFGVIEVSIDKNTNMNFMITEKKLLLSKAALSLLLKTLLFSKIISPRLLHGVLEEYYTYKKEIENG